MVAATCDVYLGSDTGLFKGVDTNKKIAKNFNQVHELNRENEITSLCWGNSLENQIYVGQKNQTVKLFDCNTSTFIKRIGLDAGDGLLRGIAKYQNSLVTATDSGIVKVWDEDNETEQAKIDAGANLYRMRQNASNPYEIATGGEENDLKIWDLQKPTQPTFRAKNVRNDFLDLRVPVWVTDMQFLPDGNRIAVCSRHHHIRLYDPKSPMRRPVISMEFETYPLLSLSMAHQEWQLVVGSSRGRMALIDLRKKALVHVFKGFAGSIRHVQCHPHLPLVASCGLDRFLRVHDLNSRKLSTKIYMKSKLNCLLMRTSAMEDLSIDSTACVMDKETKKTDVVQDNDDDVWDQMKVVAPKSKGVKRPLPTNGASITKSRRKKIKK